MDKQDEFKWGVFFWIGIGLLVVWMVFIRGPDKNARPGDFAPYSVDDGRQNLTKPVEGAPGPRKGKGWNDP